mgnify:FL=1
MESSRSDHPPQTVSRSDRQPSHDMQWATCGAPLTSQCTANGYLASCQHHARHEYTLPPGVSGEGLSELGISRGYFTLHPNDCYTVRQQDLLDMDQDMGNEDDWTYRKDDDIDFQSEESYHSLDTHAPDDGPPPPPLAAHKAPPTPRFRGPPAPPEDRVVQPPQFMHLPPTPMPPVVPNRNHADTVEPHAQPRSDSRLGGKESDLEGKEFERYFKPKSNAAIHDERRISFTTLGNSPELFSRDCPPTSSDLLSCVPPLKDSDVFTRMALLKASYKHPVYNDEDSRAIASAHMSRVNDELRGPQLSRGPSGATSSELGASSEEQITIFPPTPIRRPAQPPPPLPSNRDPLRRPAQQPPPLPPPCYGLEYFKNCVRITTHWNQHLNALQHFRDWCRKRILTSVVLDSWTCEAADWSADRPTWCWDSLLAQLTDDSLRRVVEGTHGASGIVACMVREGSTVDGRRRSAADQAFSSRSEVLYHWEFAFLRNDRTIAFLRPLPRLCSIEYNEGVPKDESAVATPTFRRVTTPATNDESLPEFCFGEYDNITCRFANLNQHWPKDWFPNMSSLELVCHGHVKFLEHRSGNLAKRGSVFRASPKRGMGGK